MNSHKVLNGFKTCAPLYFAICELGATNADSEFKSLLEKIERYSNSIAQKVDLQNKTERAILNSLILELVRIACALEQDHILNCEKTFTKIIISSISNSAVSAELTDYSRDDITYFLAKMFIEVKTRFVGFEVNEADLRAFFEYLFDAISEFARTQTDNVSEQEKLALLILKSVGPLISALFEQELATYKRELLLSEKPEIKLMFPIIIKEAKYALNSLSQILRNFHEVPDS